MRNLEYKIEQSLANLAICICRVLNSFVNKREKLGKNFLMNQRKSSIRELLNFEISTLFCSLFVKHQKFSILIFFIIIFVLSCRRRNLKFHHRNSLFNSYRWVVQEKERVACSLKFIKFPPSRPDSIQTSTSLSFSSRSKQHNDIIQHCTMREKN